MTTEVEVSHNDLCFDSESSQDNSFSAVSKFWTRPDDSPESTINEDEDSSTLRDAVNGAFYSEQTYYSLASHQPGDVNTTTTATVQDSKRQQTKMLLVSLIESFCRIYGDSPDANRKVFFLICQTLNSLGFIDAEFEDEMTRTRSNFQRAFRKLFYSAVQTVRKQDFRLEAEQRLIGGASSVVTQGSLRSPPPPPPPPPTTTTTTTSATTATADTLTYPDEGLNYSRPLVRRGSNAGHFSNLSVHNSRYHNDFIEINLLGRGGFASAWRARNRLDDVEYAVKKIRLGKDLLEQDEKTFREIKHLARLEHRNVVRYYASWLEHSDASPVLREVDSDDEGDDESSMSQGSIHSVFNGRDPTFDDDDDLRMRAPVDGLSGIEFVHEGPVSGHASESAYHSSPQSMDEFVAEAAAAAAHPEDGDCFPWPSHPLPHQRRSSAFARQGGGGEWILYLQMQLCPSTLHEYIKYRNRGCAEQGHGRVDRQRNIEIFSQLLDGAAYIHDQGLVHRDLKPSNIFLSMPTTGEHRRQHRRASSIHEHGFSYNAVLHGGSLRECMWEEPWVPKIGDFGLAATTKPPAPVHAMAASIASSCCSSTLTNTPPRTSDGSATTVATATTMATTFSPDLNAKRSIPKRSLKNTTAVGTRTYASPEQLASPPLPYGDKSDIYSLGIIFFELCQPFATSMERAEAIEQLKKGVFPNGFVEHFPKESALILWMMSDDPSQRPSAAQLLDFELFAPSPMQDQDVYQNLQAQLQAQSLALETKNRQVAELMEHMERRERESEREVGDLHRQLEELQRQLQHASFDPERRVQLDHAVGIDPSTHLSNWPRAFV